MHEESVVLMRFTSLFLESGYSFNGSNVLLESLLSHAKKAHYDVVTLTDSKMHYAYTFYQQVKATGMDPVIGLQVKLEPLLDGDYIHVTCYAQSSIGFKNLLKLSSLQSFNGKMPLKLFSKYLKGISVVIGIHTGEVVKYLNDQHHLTLLINEIKSVHAQLYLAYNPAIPVIKQDVVPVLYVDYVRFVGKEDYAVFSALKKIFQLPEEPMFEDVPGYLKSDGYFDDIEDSYKDGVDAFIEAHIFDLDMKAPDLPRYKDTQGLTSQKYLKALAHKGMNKRIKGKDVDATLYSKRLVEELMTIHELGYDDYFLIVWDVVRFAKREGYLVGPGRGSAPGSLVAYSLGITDVDPIEFDLLFERFLNKARQTMPDIDIDFPDYARDAIIEYTKSRYGQAFVSYICTFGTFLKRSALRDSARAFNVEAKYVNEMAKRLNAYDYIHDMVAEDKDVQNRIEQHENIALWLNAASKIQGLPKHVGTHAAGVVLSSEPIVEYTAIQPGLNNSYQTQYAMEDLERIGLLKMDFLGLRNLSMIETIINDIDSHEHHRLNMYQLPLDDEKTFTLLREGSTTGIFQLESPGMRRLIKAMKIRSFDDIVVILALYRPGPMESIPDYLKRREKRVKITYLHETLKPILEPTEGILLYQEQIMAIASAFAGYSMQEADLLRRAVSKKDGSVLETERARFVRKSYENGKSKTLANAIYDYIVKFANYGFNKSHSVAYGLISYWMAYLKANYPAYFIGVLMQNALSNEGLMKAYIQEAMQLKITVVGPDVNISSHRFVFKEQKLYYPLIGIKNIGKSVLSIIDSARQDGMFEHFADFVSRTKAGVNKRSYQYLIYAGACDIFGMNKKTMIENIDALLQFLDYQGVGAINEFVYDQHEEFEQDQLKHFEKEALGFSFKYDALSKYMHLYEESDVYAPSEVLDIPLEKPIKMLALVGRIHEITTKKGDKMAFLTLEDKTEKVDAVCFPGVYHQSVDVLKVDGVFYLKGRLTLKDSKRQFVVEEVKIVD